MLPSKDLEVMIIEGRRASSKEYEEARSSLSNLAEKIEYEVSKFSLGIMISSSKDQGESLAEALKLPVQMFSRSLRGIVPFLKTKSLRKIIVQECGHVLRAVSEFVKSCLDVVDNGGETLDPTKVGLVSEYCKRLKMRIPKSEKTACKRFIMSSILQIKDTAEEFQQNISDEKNDEDLGFEDDLFFGDDGEEKKITANEKSIIAIAVKVFRRCNRLVKTHCQACVALPDSLSKSQTKLADSFVEQSNKILSTITDIGCCLYIPINKESCDEIKTHCESMLQLVKTSNSMLMEVPAIKDDDKIVKRVSDVVCGELREALCELQNCKYLIERDEE